MTLPIFYHDAEKEPAPSRRPLLTLPGIDYDYYPELEADGALPRFGEMDGMFEIPFPYGFPYMDFQVLDLLNVKSGMIPFPIKATGEIFLLEQITLSWPNAGAGAYPDTAPTAAESPIPTIQVSSSDPTLRHGRYAATGPELFFKPLPLNHVSNGPGAPGNKGIKFDRRRLIPFGERDTILMEIKKTSVDPRWIGIGIIGRLVTPTFLQGILK